jgi:hypothetical protein
MEASLDRLNVSLSDGLGGSGDDAEVRSRVLASACPPVGILEAHTSQS